ncbi:Hypothetical protein SRAE_X000191300 [Strongyloides ratti]|uniref:Uncharacterized protein n=1 Tax=Strongyloides ratti TaxID=34506 RepID=A0A090KY95_STRRB|nr:Hypothetical protein SRAE_X000191300 [Strongyloides ratti]CEF60173.1 Hypothetical protein SRAE_X000191300 [Strongyloides ratti]
MHFIKYLAIFAIFAIQFSLQEVSSEDDSNQVAVLSQEENNLPLKQTQTGGKSLFSSFKNKVSEKANGLKSKIVQAKDKVKLGLEKAKNEVNKRVSSSPKLQKSLNFANNLKDKTLNAGKKLKNKVLKFF